MTNVKQKYLTTIQKTQENLKIKQEKLRKTQQTKNKENPNKTRKSK